MNKNIESRPMVRVIGMLLVATLITAGPAMAAKKQEPPQTTTDGLNLVKKTKTRIVYLADGAEFDQYTKVMIVECAVAFKKNWQRDYNRTAVDLSRRVTDRDVTRIKEGVSAEFKKEFTKVMTENGHEVVTEPASDVLILRPAIINLVVNAPDIQSTGMSRTYVADPGQMTLYLELYDSVSSTKLALIMDAVDIGRVAPSMSYANRVTNIAAADRVLKRWAEELSGHLGEVSVGSGK
jgi:hypothetical protein